MKRIWSTTDLEAYWTLSTTERELALALLCLHLLQVSLVYVNTLMVQQVLKAERWQNRLNSDDMRALTPLFFGHVTPYGTFDINLDTRLLLDDPD